MALFGKLEPAYESLVTQELSLEEGPQPEVPRKPHNRSIWSVVTRSILFPLAFGGLCFLVGRSSASSTTVVEQSVPTTFWYNETYSQPPSGPSNQAWLSLFPRAHGFVKPPGTPSLAVLSVFHQLHCVNVLRHGYYVARDDSYKAESLKDITISRESVKHEHIIHCFDYLRQSLECFSDKSVEPVNISRGGATGWGSVHQCRDHRETLRFADTWEVRAE